MFLACLRKESGHWSADDELDPGEHARSQQAVGIRDGGSGVDRTARPVERIVHEIKSALPGDMISNHPAREDLLDHVRCCLEVPPVGIFICCRDNNSAPALASILRSSSSDIDS